MQPALFLTEIERSLPLADIPTVVAALKEDELVWSTLQQPGFIRSILSEGSTAVSAWTPASLALKPLGDRVRFSELTSDYLPGIEGSLRKQAMTLLESTIKKGLAVSNLTDAGMIALALRERRRKMQSWQGIYTALTSMRAKSSQHLFEAWKTPLTCLFSIIPDQKDLLLSLLPEDKLHPAMEWITHILMSNPLEAETRIELFGYVMGNLSLEWQVEWLRYLKRKGQSTLACNLANHILAEKGDLLEIGKQELNPDQADWIDLSRMVLDHQIGATLHQLAGHPLQAGLHLEKVSHLLQHWLVGSTIQLVSVSDHEGSKTNEISTQCARMVKQFSVSENLVAESLYLFESKAPSFTLSDPDYSSAPLLVKMDQAKQLLQSGSRRQAQEIAYVAVQNWLKQAEKDPSILSGQFLFELNPYGVLNQLVDLGLYSDAITVGEKFLIVRPEDLDLMLWLSEVCHRIGEDEKAINLLYQVALFDPGKPETFRKQAAIYEDRNEWKAALDVRRRVLDIVPLPAIEDHLLLARSAYGAQDYREVQQTCEKVLSIDPEQGMAYTYLGMACIANSDLANGLANLNKATLLIPENPMPWIQLAEAYKKNDEPQRALETLRTAIITAPDSAELHFAIGSTCLEAGLTSEALPFLRQSAKLAPESDRVGLALAKTLLKLGHETDALAIIEKTRENWPAHAELAYLHAKILLDRKETDRGLSILEIALQADEANPTWFILYAKTLIGEYERYSGIESEEPDTAALVKAYKMIQKAVSIAPDSLEANLLLAEVLSLRGEHEAAYAAYKQIVELPEARLPEWNWRVQAGLGKTALALQQTETALASLQNAVTINPESLISQRSLSLAYRQANLNESAQDSARAALALAPDEIPNLIWFCEFMGSVGAEDEAVEGYRVARQLAPERVDLAVKLAEACLAKGDLEETHSVLEQASQMERIDAEELRQVAHAYMRMGDHSHALASMERAVQANVDNNPGYLFELADLYAKAGDLEKSLETMQKAIREQPGRVDHYLFLSEVQDRLNRPQAALASLEHVLRLIGVQTTSDEFDTIDGRPETATNRIKWQPPSCDLVDIHMRFARLLQKVENLGSALYHAEKALEECPLNVEVRYLAADLAMKQLQYEHAETLVVLPELAERGAYSISSENTAVEYWRSELTSLRAELALERKDFTNAARLIKEGLDLSPDHPRLLMDEIQLLARSGDYQSGNERFDELSPSVETGGSHTAGKDDLICSLAAAALSLKRWEEGLALYGKYTHANPSEPQGLLKYAAALAQAAEWQGLSDPLRLYKHIAPEMILSEDHFIRFSQIIADAKKFGTSAEIERWKARGDAAFHPTSSSLQALATQSTNAEDISVLMQAMNKLGNIEDARQIGEKYLNDAQVNLQLSLLSLKDDPAYALEKSQSAIAIDPKNPILHAAAARAQERLGDCENALDSLKIAIFYWPEEALWHEWAGRMAEGCDQFTDACEHYEQAMEIVPESLEITVKLGKAYMRVGRADAAVEMFSKASKQDPQSAELWFNLAEAQFASGDQRQALLSAETSAKLNPNSSAAKVLCGEISLALGGETKALTMVREALRLDPANIRARLLNSKILSSKGKHREALEEISKAVEEIPDAVELLTEKVRLIYQLHGASEALKLLLPVVQSHPNNQELLALQAKACIEVGDMEQAESAAIQALRLNTTQTDMQRLLGNIYKQTGQLDKSLHHMSEAVRMQPEDVELNLELGEVYTIRREYEQALKIFQQAMKSSPEDYRPYYQSALVLRDGKDYPGAESMMRRAAQLAPHDVNIRRQLGAIVALNLVQSCQEAHTCQ